MRIRIPASGNSVKLESSSRMSSPLTELDDDDLPDTKHGIEALESQKTHPVSISTASGARLNHAPGIPGGASIIESASSRHPQSNVEIVVTGPKRGRKASNDQKVETESGDDYTPHDTGRKKPRLNHKVEPRPGARADREV